MRIEDRGVDEKSRIELMMTSDFARSALFYAPRSGRFICNSDYRVERDYLDMFLLMYICHGSLRVTTRGKQYVACEDQVVLLDCHHPHRYESIDSVDFIWFHYLGSASEQYGEYLYAQGGVVFSGAHVPALREYFQMILNSAQLLFPNEHLVSVSIHTILSRLATEGGDHIALGDLLMPSID
ncbi:MAG: AraC family ligand binding domain-containing protein, partial [Clostridia bacterium]|nr:AraC family ligand binding domain-containing protein [Clostridia bacterium]